MIAGIINTGLKKNSMNGPAYLVAIIAPIIHFKKKVTQLNSILKKTIYFKIKNFLL